jgi:peptidoglycan/LPS O-acetylase OafA/YrhL
VQNKRVFGLDLVRTIAIILVVVSHCTFILHEETNNPILVAIRSLGAIGVDLFFVLSGYLIGGILLNQIHENQTKFKDFLRFWKRRWFRTLPNYFLILLVNILIVLLVGETLPDNSFLYVLFLQNFSEPHPDFFTEAWSLSIEEYSYLILPLILFFCLNIFKREYAKQNVFIRVTFGLIVAQLLFKIGFYVDANITSYKDWSATFRKVVIYRLDAIYYGFIVIYYYTKYPQFFKKYSKILCILSLVTFAMTHLLIYTNDLLPQTHLAFYVFAYLPIIAICCGLTFPFAVTLEVKKGLGKIIYFLSTRSYAIYLVNFSIILLNLKTICNLEVMSLPFKLMMILLFLLLTLVLSDIVYRYFEKPILNLRDRIYKNSKVNH